LAMDQYGDVWVVGNDYGASTGFTTSDGSEITLKKDPSAPTGAFALRYNPKGDLLNAFMIPNGASFDVTDLVIDPDGNFLVAGSYQFRNYDRKSEVRRSYLLMKFKPDFSPLWEMRGDTIGQSNLQGLCTDQQGNVFATGGYNSQIRLGKKTLVTKGSDAIAFVVKLNSKGRISWIQDSLGSFRKGAGKSIVCDSRGAAYLITSTSYSLNLISKLHQNGSLAWSHTIKGKASNYFERLVMDEAERLYLCGQGYGTTFGTTEGNTLTYKAVGGTDPYIACYTTDGVLLWLRAAGGKGTDYLKSIAVSNGKLYAFGWFGGEMRFRDTLLKSRSGYVFWQARYDINLMSRMDILPPPSQITAIPDTVFDRENCTCTRRPEERTSVFYNSMESLVTYEQFMRITGWKSPYPEYSFRSLFYKNFQFSTSYQSGFYSLTAIGIRKPVTFVHPAGTYAINFTPCTHNLHRFEVPMTVSIDHRMKRHVRNFDPEAFDHSTKAYFDLFMAIKETDVEELASEGTLALFHAAIRANDLYMLDEVFQEHYPDISVKWINSMLNPDIRSSIESKYIGIEFDPKLIRPWNSTTQLPVTDSTGAQIPYRILAETPKGFNYSTDDGLRIQTGSICAPTAEITRTGWLLDFDHLVLIAEPETRQQVLQYTDYPYFHKDPNWRITDFSALRHDARHYDTLLTRFTGVLIAAAQLEIPVRHQYITGIGSNILLNNHLFCGTLRLPMEEANAGHIGGALYINLKSGDKVIPISLQELEAIFYGMGFQDILIQMEEKQLAIQFRKMTR